MIGPYTLILVLVVCMLPRDRIWADLILAFFFICSDVQRFSLHTDVAQLSEMPFNTFMVLCFLGVHSYAITLYLLTHWVLQLNIDAVGAWFSGLTGVGLLTLACMAEYRVSALLLDLQRKNTVTETLLDNATDGFCSVDCSSGIIRSASPNLEYTFGTTNLVGARLTDFIHHGDHGVIVDLLDSASQLQTASPDPVLVSCIQDNNSGPKAAGESGNVYSFDAKIILLAVSQTTLYLCMQMMGEFRSQVTSYYPSENDVNASSDKLSLDVRSEREDGEEDIGLPPTASRCVSLSILPQNDDVLEIPAIPMRRSASTGSIITGRSLGAPSEISFIYTVTQGGGSERSFATTRRSTRTGFSNVPQMKCRSVSVALQTDPEPEPDTSPAYKEMPYPCESDAAASQDVATETEIVWQREGFTCKRCARPPVLPIPTSGLGTELPRALPASRVRRGRSLGQRLLPNLLQRSTTESSPEQQKPKNGAKNARCGRRRLGMNVSAKMFESNP